MRAIAICVCVLASACPKPLLAQVVTTVAGTSSLFPSNIQALAAPLGPIGSVAVDRSGNIYAPDSGNNIVVRISPAGVLTVVAGNGSADFGGDGGPATSASLFFPAGVALDSSGNLYIADSFNNRVRKVSVDGIITTIAGTGAIGFSGDGGLAIRAALSYPSAVGVDPAGNLYIADEANHRIRKVSGGVITTAAGNGTVNFSGDGGPATSASLFNPAGVAIDAAGNLYIADEKDNRVRKVSSGIITTVAGTGSAAFSGDGGVGTAATLNGPAGVAVDSNGTLYIADAGNRRIRKLSAGVISTVAGNGFGGFSGDGGFALTASLNGLGEASTTVFGPMGIAVDQSGNVYIADTLNFRIRKVAVADGRITTVAGNGAFGSFGDGGPSVSATLANPTGVIADKLGNLYIADGFRVRKLSGGKITTVAGNGFIGFSGDGGPAVSASLSASGIAIDSVGTLYIADRANHRIRRVAGGIITTVAGNGKGDFAGDGGQAIQASLFNPAGVCVDSVGNLYIADGYNNRVRKVTPGGIITTIAGTGAIGFAGDGGSATNAILSYPAAVAIDSADSVYVADEANHRIRKISGGIITTVVGNGSVNFPGDGGPATAASLFNPTALAFDSKDALYIADSNNNRIRRVTNGFISTIAGNGNYSFSGDGGLATAATLRVPQGVAVDGTGNVYIADTNNFRVREVFANGISYTATPNALTFSASAGGGAPAQQTVSLISSISGFQFSASTTVPWLTVSSSSGSVPASLQVGADPSQLSPGTYSGAIVFNVPSAVPSTQVVDVVFKVNAATPGTLVVGNQSLTFAVTKDAPPASLSITLTNGGSGAIKYVAMNSTANGGNWLAVSPASGTLTAAAPQTLTVTATPGTLGVGSYTGTLVIVSGDTGQNITVPVSLAVSSSSKTILLSQTGLTFTAVEHSGDPLPQTFEILNTGQGEMNWRAAVSTSSTDGAWLSINTPTGTVKNPFTDVSAIDVTIDSSALKSGTYYGQVLISADGAANSAQSVSIILNVLPPGSNPGPEIRPTGIIFIGPAGTIPPSQDVQVGTGQVDNFTSGFIPGAFTYAPANAQVKPNAPTALRVFPNFDGLPPGTVRRGTITLQFSDGTPRTISVLTVVGPNGPSSATTGKSSVRLDTGCASSSALVLPTSLTNSSSTAVASQPTSIRVRVVDGCGNPLTAGTVSATFSNGDPSVSLVHVGNGNWAGTWVPVRQVGSMVTVKFAALPTPASLLANGETQIAVSVKPGSAPVGTLVTNAASFRGQSIIAQGGVVSFFGMQLADSDVIADSLPLPAQIGGTKVLLGGKAIPLTFVGKGQVNAQIPFDAQLNTPLQLVLQHGDAISVPLTVTAVPADPAIYTIDGSGSGSGLFTDASAQLLTDSNRPTEGDTIVMYGNALGPVDPSVTTGAPAPIGGPLSRTISPVTVTIGGVDAHVDFAGLVPGYPNLYQVNAVVPCHSDQDVPVVVTVGSRASPVVNLTRPGRPGGTPGIQHGVECATN